MSKTVKPPNPRDNEMARGKYNSLSNINQGYMTSSEPSLHTNTKEKKKIWLYFKSLNMMMLKDIKKDINNSIKEIQEN